MIAPDDDLQVTLSQLRCLQDQEYTWTELSGGLTNRNLKVTTSDARYVVRISHPGPGLLEIDRDCEHYNSVAAAEAGVGAPVIEYRPELRILVVGFIEAHTCSKTDLQNLDQLGRAVDACRQLHDGPRFCNEFNMFELQANYLATVRQRGFRLPDRYLEFLPEAERIRSSLAATDEGTRPCHNDLLAENCLDNGRKAWLIDYEYSGNNDPCFELGNLWSESNLSLDHLEMMVARYYGSPSSQKVARARLQGLMSKYGWTLWASIQDATAPLDFDFWSWGMEKYERAVAELTSDQFDHLLDTAAGR